MIFKVVIDGADGDETLSLETRKLPIVRTILEQYDHEGASIHLEIHVDGEEIYKVLQNIEGSGSRSVRDPSRPSRVPLLSILGTPIDTILTNKTPQPVRFIKPSSSTSPNTDLYPMGDKEIICTYCEGKFILEDKERNNRYIECPHCNETLDWETYPHGASGFK